MTTLAMLTLNRVGPVRRERVDGADYLLAPLTLIVPGVLAGSNGALLYRPDDVRRSAPAWANVPLTIGHPTDPAGRHLSANSPGVKSVGRVTAPTVTPDGRLTAVGRFDVAALRQQNPALLRRLERGEPVECSTGLFLDKTPAPSGATYNGRLYSWVATSYRPDHLAVLPNEKGACALTDGCGVNPRPTLTKERPMTAVVNRDDKLEVPTLLDLIANEKQATKRAGGCGCDGPDDDHEPTGNNDGGLHVPHLLDIPDPTARRPRR